MDVLGVSPGTPRQETPRRNSKLVSSKVVLRRQTHTKRSETTDSLLRKDILLLMTCLITSPRGGYLVLRENPSVSPKRSTRSLGSYSNNRYLVREDTEGVPRW